MEYGSPKLKFRLHRAVIVLFCLALLVVLMQGGVVVLARIINGNGIRSLRSWPARWARQVTLNVAPAMRTETPDDKRISQVLRQLTENSRILDAGVYG
ncbi:Virulence factor, hemolysin regulator [Enterobacter cloacae]|uniref:Virulence factor, hemolysin regulator n=1 Tax=Enterobacter cloacae TaxID=550 RepID=A0A377M6G5_ENTCL|nr:Virulence factor, hemolysin regulator [Enterobacter cloacae]